MKQYISRNICVALSILWITLVTNECNLHASPCCTVSNSGNLVAYVCRDNIDGNDYKEYISIWDVTTGKEKRRLIGNLKGWGLNEGIRKIVFSKNEEYLVEWSHLGIKIWDTTTGEILNEIKEKIDFTLFSSDGDYCILPPVPARNISGEIMFETNGFRIISLPDLRNLGNIAPATAMHSISSMNLSADNKLLYLCAPEYVNGISDGIKKRRIYDVSSKKVISVMDKSIKEDNKFYIYKDYIFESSTDKVLVRDGKTGGEIRQLQVKHNGFVPRLVFQLKARPHTVFIQEKDLFTSYLNEYELSTGELLQEYPLKKQDKVRVESNIAFSPTGSYICWCNDKNKLNLHKIVRTKQNNLVYDVQFRSYNVVRRSTAFIEDLNIMSRSTGLQEYHETLNDKNGWWKSIKEDPVAISNALNHLRTPVESLDRNLAIDRSKPRLFLLAVGINEHEIKEYNLDYSRNDANAFFHRVKQDRGNIYGDVQSQILLDKDCTLPKLKDSLEWLKRSSTSKDIVIVFFSGHGIKGKKGLYFFSHHGDEENIQSTCYNWSDIAQLLTQTQAKHIFFIADCCHAGSFSKERFAPQNKQFEELQKANHISILAACSRNEHSEERSNLNHGVFTYALLEGLNGSADNNQDKYISWQELTSYVIKAVPAMTNNQQHPVLIKDINSSNKTIILHRY